MSKQARTWAVVAGVGLWALVLGSAALRAQTEAADEPAAPATQPAATPERSLADRQAALAARYKLFDRTLEQMARHLREIEPERAELLDRAISKSRGAQIHTRMAAIRKILADDDPLYAEAIEGEDEVLGQLRELLTLLESEDRLSEIERERQYIQNMLRQLGLRIAEEKDVRAGTERGDAPDKLGDKQQGVAGRTRELADRIDEHDGQSKDGDKTEDGSSDDAKQNQSGDKKPTDPKNKTGKSGKNAKPGDKTDKSDSDAKPSDSTEDNPSDDNKNGKSGQNKSGQNKSGSKNSKSGKNGKSDDKPKPDEKNSNDSRKSDEQKPGDQPSSDQPSDSQSGKPSQGKSGKSQSRPQPLGQRPQGDNPQDQQNQGQQQDQSDDQQQANRTPGRQEIERAIEKMQRAIEELKKQNRDNASREQDDAIAELLKAKEKLEDILRQLREEEKELMLAALEARFQKMLKIQIEVLGTTEELAAVRQKDKWSPRESLRAVDQAVKEDEIAREADRALLLLKEEGSSVAFPQAVEQIRDDMRDVAGRLQQEDVGDVTIVIEKDIVEALKEMVDALRKELEKLKQKKQQGQQGKGQQSDPALVDQLAELKLLRSLQHRVNRRTRILAREIEGDGEQATRPELVRRLQELSRWQARIQEATYNIATGRNK